MIKKIQEVGKVFGGKKNKNSEFWIPKNVKDAFSKENLEKGKQAGDNGENAGFTYILQLAEIKRAIKNFVQILTNKNIPVNYLNKEHGGFTDGKSVYISGDIDQDLNFDKTVGLALHEASHIVLSDMEELKAIQFNDVTERIFNTVATVRKSFSKHVKSTKDSTFSMDKINFELYAIQLKDLLNWVEDRRVDAYIQKDSPGYIGYYQSLYDEYFNIQEVKDLINSPKSRKPIFENYMFHVINLISIHSDENALLGLKEIKELVDFKNILRLKNMHDSFDIATKIFEIILTNIDLTLQKEKENEMKNLAKMIEKLQKQADKNSKQSMKGDPQKSSGNGQPMPMPKDEDDESKDEKDNDKDSDNEKEQDSKDTGNKEDKDGGKGKDKDSKDKDNKDKDGSGEGDEEDEGENGEEKDGNGKGKDGDNDDNDENSDGEDGKDGNEKDSEDDDDNGIDGPDASEDVMVGEESSDENTKDAKEGKSGKYAEASAKEVADAIKDTLQNIGKLLNHEIEKQELPTGITDKVHSLSGMKVRTKEITMVHPKQGTIKTRVILVPELTKSLIDQNMLPITTTWAHNDGTIQDGINIGKKLVNKIKIRNESRKLMTPRQKSGKLQQRSLSDLAYDSENVFYRLTSEEFKSMHFHISVDASGSMSGSKWKETIKMLTAITYAACKIKNIDVVVDFRSWLDTGGNGYDSGIGNDAQHYFPFVLTAFDSRHQSFTTYCELVNHIHADGMTPEGMCFQAMLDEYVPGSHTKDSVFINLSDGFPGCAIQFNNGRRLNSIEYREFGIKHTAEIVRRIKKMNIEVISYFINGGWGSDIVYFKQMYGRDAKQVSPHDVMQIAKSINEKLLKK